MNNLFITKCAVNPISLKDRKIRGAKFIEIHLNHDEPVNESDVRRMTQDIKDSGLEARVVHLPIKWTCSVEAFGTPYMKERARLACELAKSMYEIHRQQMVMVIHQEMCLGNMVAFGLIEGIEASFKHFVNEYPMIDFALENSTLINYIDGVLYTRNSHYLETVKLANYLREKLDTDRIGTVLDTCHVLANLVVHNLIVDDVAVKKLTMEDFFLANKSVLKLVHLANAIHYSIGKDHALPFVTQEDHRVLEQILQCMRDINYEGMVTLEINEANPQSAEWFSYTRSYLMSRGIKNV